MASINNNITINFETRLCTVNGEYGYFHCWEHYSTVIDPSPLMGGHPGGTISYINGIVEFPDGSVRRVPLERIKFCDEQQMYLARIAKTSDQLSDEKDY